MMNLESLANEILLDLFEYLDVVNLLRAFNDLNHRFSQLIFTKSHRHHLDFCSISKHDFEIVCRKYLPSIMARIISLRLSDDDETPNLPQVFLASGHLISQFSHLRSFSIDFTHSFDLLKQTTFECRELLYLTHLRIHIKNYQDPNEDMLEFINNIWSLPKLTHCYLDIVYPYSTWLMNMSIISQSINYLSTTGISYDHDNLSHLFKHTPHLKRLDMGSFNQYRVPQLQTISSSLISLRMGSCFTVDWMKHLFKGIPNLCYLAIQLNNIRLDGYAWEKILISHFMHIKGFRLKMTVEFSVMDDAGEQVDRLLDSFRSHFWIEKHRWFVRCDWCPIDINMPGLLYTLPYTFETFSYNNDTQSRSTAPNDMDYSTYGQVQTLHHIHRKKISYNNSSFSPIQFVNIRHLEVKLPFNDHFWSLIPKLDRLISLDATLNEDLGYSQLQLLLNQAPHLYSLSFCQWNKFSMASFNINSRSIHRLEFFQNSGFRLRYFNTAECVMLANSPLGSQCEVLIIDVESRKEILDLINTMPNLRALSVTCRDGKKNRYESLEINDDFTQWLHDYLPFNHTYSISFKGSASIARINLWFHRRV